MLQKRSISYNVLPVSKRKAQAANSDLACVEANDPISSTLPTLANVSKNVRVSRNLTSDLLQTVSLPAIRNSPVKNTPHFLKVNKSPSDKV